tara:strand:- start:455 stop:754 length:300 start_codon:yes stop_codon:yes gene_type:complete
MGSIINLWDRPDLRALPVEMNSTKKTSGGCRRESLRKWRNGCSRINSTKKLEDLGKQLVVLFGTISTKGWQTVNAMAVAKTKWKQILKTALKIVKRSVV